MAASIETVPILSTRRADIITGSEVMAWSTRFIWKMVGVLPQPMGANSQVEKEREAGRSLFSAFNPMDNDESVVGLETDGVANTNIIWHGGKLLALKKATHPLNWILIA